MVEARLINKRIYLRVFPISRQANIRQNPFLPTPAPVPTLSLIEASGAKSETQAAG